MKKHFTLQIGYGFFLIVIIFSCKVSMTYTYPATVNGTSKLINFIVPGGYMSAPFFQIDSTTTSKLFVYPDSSSFYITQDDPIYSPNFVNVSASKMDSMIVSEKDTAWVFYGTYDDQFWTEIHLNRKIWFGYNNVPVSQKVLFDESVQKTVKKWGFFVKEERN